MTPPPFSRNALCPCGSGRKYKRCCLRKDRAAQLAYTAQERERAFAKLHRFGDRAELRKDRELAELLFWGSRLEEVSLVQRRELLQDHHSLGAFLHWYLFDMSIEHDGDTVVARFLSGAGAPLSLGERTYLERMAGSSLRLYEIQSVEPDVGFTFGDLWTDDVIRVRERLGTQQLVRWDLLAARVVAGPEGALVVEGVPFPYPSESKDALLKELRRRHKQLDRTIVSGSDVAFFKRAGLVFHHRWLDRMVHRAMPTMVTVEGDPVVFTKSVFDILDRGKVEAGLGTLAAFEREDEDYLWIEPTPDGTNRILGRVSVSDRLTLETQSDARAARGRQLLEEILAGAIRFRATLHEDVESVIARAPRREPSVASEPPAEIQQAVVGQYYERHYREWPNIPLPALKGRTPRHAATLKTLKPAVVALVKSLENSMDRERLEGRPAVDVSWLWDELGLERP